MEPIFTVEPIATAEPVSAVETFQKILPKLGEGLLGIFIVTAIIIISIVALNLLTKGGKRRSNPENNQTL